MHSGSLAGRSKLVIVERGGGIEKKKKSRCAALSGTNQDLLLFFDLRNSPKNSLNRLRFNKSQLGSFRTFHVSWLVAKNVSKSRPPSQQKKWLFISLRPIGAIKIKNWPRSSIFFLPPPNPPSNQAVTCDVDKFVVVGQLS